MRILQKFFTTLFLGFVVCNAAYAGIPVLDSANLAQAIQQVTAWAEQAKQMAAQIKEMEETNRNMSGVRGMGDLANNPASRNYLPSDYQSILNNGVGNWKAIYEAAKIYDIALSSLAANSDTSQAFQQAARQAAINRAAAEEGYLAASQRFAAIQVLLDKVNAAPDAKDIADLQARIQAEQVMMQNEANKLQTLAQLAQAQRDLQAQQAREISIKALKGNPPRF